MSAMRKNGAGSSGGGSAWVAAGPPPSIGGCTIFPADNAWNTRIDDTRKFPVHAKWSTYMTTMNLTEHLHPDWGDWSVHSPDHTLA